MSIRELRDGEQARRFLQEGLWLQRVAPPNPVTVQAALRWALEAASAGQPLPPIGFVADLAHVALGQDHGPRGGRDAAGGAGLPAALARTYEDHVLGKLYADWHFERATDALRRYQGRIQDRGLVFILNQFRERSHIPGVLLSPAVIRGLREMAPDDVLARGWETLTRDGLMPLLPELYEGLIAAARRTGQVLDPEDIDELEKGTFPQEMGHRVAFRQLNQAAHRLESSLPQHKVRPLAGRQEVPTRVLDEDTYPVGGYSSVSTRGTIESLLHSQLAYMEKEGRPDLFDIKYLRDELLYYSRDENQFLRRRRTFIFALFPDLLRTRFKDPVLPWQRIVLVMALLVTAVRKLAEWLSTDSLLFEFLFLEPAEGDALTDERKLLELVLREQIANGTVRIDKLSGFETRGLQALAEHCGRRARRSLCHCLLVGTEPYELRADDTVVSSLRIDSPVPELHVVGEPPDEITADGPLESWSATLERLLQVWI
jgi:hypothetical protein